MPAIARCAGGADAFKALLGPPDENGCMAWLGHFRDGVGCVHLKNRFWVASRYGWHLFKGPIPGSRMLWPTCGNDLCVNVDHFAEGASSSYTPGRIKNLFHCSVPEYLAFHKLGMTSPYRAAVHGAAVRGIEFNFTLPEWCSVWLQSGHWQDRGPLGFHMCRRGDVGPYSADNVYIAPWQVNRAEAIAVKRSKCSGVRITPYGFFATSIGVNRKTIHLGVRATEAEARSLYAEAVAALASSPDGKLPADFVSSRKIKRLSSRQLNSTSAKAVQVSSSSI